MPFVSSGSTTVASRSDYIGLDGSPTIVAGVDPIPKAPSEREATVVDPDDTEGMEAVFEEMAAYAGGG